MGVYPEPAPCADDASRLVPTAQLPVNEGAAVGPRRTHNSILGDVTRGLFAGLILGLAAVAGPSVLAHEGSDAFEAARIRTDLRTGDGTAEWGGESLNGREPLTLAVLDNHPASPPEPKADAEVLRFGEMSVRRTLVDTILRASEATGVDPVYMMALADKESSFDTDVKSSASSAQGLFQFVTGTWLEMIRDYGARHGLADEAASVKRRGGAIGIADEGMRRRVLSLRNDPYVAGLMAGELIKRDRSRIENRIGRELKTTELYIAHFLGTASAGKFLSLSAESPDRDAGKAFGRAARANRSIFTSKDGSKRRSLTVGEVHERLDGMIDRRLGQYQAIAEIAAREEQQFDAEHGIEAPILDARLRLKQDMEPALTASVVQ